MYDFLQPQGVYYQEYRVAPVPAPPEPDEEGDMLNDFKVGCDPEFILLGPGGRMKPASDYFPWTGEIGYDHGGRVAEFRPGPTLGIIPIMKKIQALVSRAKAAVAHDGRVLFRAGALCNGESLGGHVHFGFPAFTHAHNNIGTRNGIPMNARGVATAAALDELTKALEHLDILPKNESQLRRTHGQNYGRFGDVRDCHGHMEYRTMASWLYDPKVAFLCLTAAKLAAVDPEGTKTALAGCDSFAKFKRWLETYENRDVNAKRASEMLLAGGLRTLQVDPSVDFGERWAELGI
jgi:hypothetical protein